MYNLFSLFFSNSFYYSGFLYNLPINIIVTIIVIIVIVMVDLLFVNMIFIELWHSGCVIVTSLFQFQFLLLFLFLFLFLLLFDLGLPIDRLHGLYLFGLIPNNTIGWFGSIGQIINILYGRDRTCLYLWLFSLIMTI